MPALLSTPRLDPYTSLLYKKDIRIQDLIDILSRNEKAILAYLTSLNNQFQNSVESVNAITTVISNLALTAQDVGFRIAGGINDRTLTVDLNLTASTGLYLTGTNNRIDVIGSTTLGQGGSVGTVNISPVYPGQESITTVGDIHTGTWSAGDITVPLGNSTQRVRNTGRLFSFTSPTGIGNPIGVQDSTLISFILPSDSLARDGQSLTLYASGKFASNGNNKTVKVSILNTALLNSGVLTLNNTDWYCTLQLTRIDLTHLACSGVFLSTNTSVVLNTPNFLTPDLTLNTIPIILIGSSPTSGVANDVLAYTEIIDYAT